MHRERVTCIVDWNPNFAWIASNKKYLLKKKMNCLEIEGTLGEEF